MSRFGWMCLAVAAVGCGRRDFNVDEVDAPTSIDSAPCTDPPAGCMDPIVYVCDGTCYAACSQYLTRPAAAAACTAWGGCLAKANTQNANDCAASHLAVGYTWLGLMQRTSATQVTADWEWCDGSPYGFTAWKLGDPDDANLDEDGAENCATLSLDGTWTDESCGQGSPFVCSRSM